MDNTIRTIRTIRFYWKIRSRRVKGLPPGIVRYVLSAEARDSSGKTHKRGTEYVPINGGFDNHVAQKYVEVVLVPKAK